MLPPLEALRDRADAPSHRSRSASRGLHLGAAAARRGRAGQGPVARRRRNDANAALRSIARRDTGEDYRAFLTPLAETTGVAKPSRPELARVDRRRKKKGSNDDWTSPADPDEKITKMKDGRPHLADKAKQAVDLDTATDPETLAEAVEQLDQVTAPDGEPVAPRQPHRHRQGRA